MMLLVGFRDIHRGSSTFRWLMVNLDFDETFTRVNDVELFHYVLGGTPKFRLLMEEISQ